ncbi:MAG: hypothetical protein H6Q73_1863 [Firmicutes bacterium]|nr:hypothetical protein [Bacillota bacterium]
MDRPEKEAKPEKDPQIVGDLHTGNGIVIFIMYILKDLLTQQMVNPLTNFRNIIELARTIAALNDSIKPPQ